jgi:hypothetical protein
MRLFCFIAGLCDASTGVLLVAAPALTLRLMGIESAPADPTFLRFVGVFVGGVGLCYLYPWLLDARRREERVWTVLEVSAGLRLLVAAFVLTSVATGALVARWSMVAVTDLAFALAQLAGIARRGARGGRERGSR